MMEEEKIEKLEKEVRKKVEKEVRVRKKGNLGNNNFITRFMLIY